jgi:hypothetical protein
MRANMEAHCCNCPVNIEQGAPQVVERNSVAIRKDDVGLLVALPHFDMGLAEDDVCADIEHERQDDEANCSRHAVISRS